jgi:hypothetical protein
MKYAIEVAHMVNGVPVSVRQLSARRERRGALLSVGLVLAGFAATMLAVAWVARLLDRSVYAPGFLGLWLGASVLAAGVAYWRVSRRLGRYALGTRLDADAFAPFEVDLVRRVRQADDRFELTIVPGMQGFIENGRAPLSVEGVTALEGRPRSVTIERDTRAEIAVLGATFIVRSVPLHADAPAEVSRDSWRLFSRVAIAGLELALLGTFLSVIPRAETIGDRPSRAHGPRITTPWEAEKWLRVEAQEQAASLHQCFDPMPLACQHPGYLGVGVSLNREGELRSNWIARSTYGQECPVDQCVKDVVSTWIFDPLPEAMRVVLPVQVLRTEKPLPPKAMARAEVTAGMDLAVDWDSGNR